MAGYKLGISRDGETGNIVLSFWDSLEGKDEHFEVIQKGQCYHTYSGPDEEEVTEVADIDAALSDFLDRVEARDGEED